MSVSFTKSDLPLTQVLTAKVGSEPPHLAFGLRGLAGTNSGLVPGTSGSVDQPFASATQQFFQAVSVDGTTLTFLTDSKRNAHTARRE